MKRIKEDIEVCMAQEELFDLTQDYSRRLEWDPYLKEGYLLSGAEEADIGVESFCKNNSGSIMISKYISYNRPKTAAVTMTKGPAILKCFSGAWNIKKISDKRSLLVFTYNFELKYGLLGKLLLPITSFLFARDMRKRLLAIREFVEANNV